MPFDLITLPCLSDNYAYLLRCHTSGEVAVIDVPEAGPILEALAARGWKAIPPLALDTRDGRHVDHPVLLLRLVRGLHGFASVGVGPIGACR